MATDRYGSLTNLASAMGLSVSQIYRVREGKRGINEKFIVGAKRAFPERSLDELFYFTDEIIHLVKIKEASLSAVAAGRHEPRPVS